jgi:formamidopyrimidine-DNA glycosylase
VPELPELQAHAERLTDELAGARLDRFEPLSFAALKTVLPPPEAAVGEPLEGVGRRGKHLLLRFAPATFVVHLMQGGRLKPDPKLAARPRGGMARWRFDGDRALLLTEAGKERKAGVWVVAGDPLAQPPLDHLGPDADVITPDQLAERLGATSMRLHGFLRDQRQLAGIGRRLADEVCHRAQLSPFATCSKLTPDQVAAVHAAIGACLDESLASERARADMSSSKDRPSAVHHRAGQACPVCGDAVRAVEYTTYTLSYCPTCQTGGKVLADNTTSRFLR